MKTAKQVILYTGDPKMSEIEFIEFGKEPVRIFKGE